MSLSTNCFKQANGKKMFLMFLIFFYTGLAELEESAAGKNINGVS